MIEKYCSNQECSAATGIVLLQGEPELTGRLNRGRVIVSNSALERSLQCWHIVQDLCCWPCFRGQGFTENDGFANNSQTRAQRHAPHRKAACRTLCWRSSELGAHAGRVHLFLRSG